MSLNQNRGLVARKREREQRRVRRAGCQQRAKPSMTVDALAAPPQRSDRVPRQKPMISQPLLPR
jgi:hypothetical protein